MFRIATIFTLSLLASCSTNSSALEEFLSIDLSFLDKMSEMSQSEVEGIYQDTVVESLDKVCGLLGKEKAPQLGSTGFVGMIVAGQMRETQSKIRSKLDEMNDEQRQTYEDEFLEELSGLAGDSCV